MYYTDAGDAMKKFCTRDGLGLELLRQHGIETCIITGEKSPIVEARARKLKISRVFIGIQDKKTVLESLIDELHLSWSQVAYVGDDLNDMEVIVRSGLSACPSDAASEIRRVAKYVCRTAGGQGAVREVCDLIRSSR